MNATCVCGAMVTVKESCFNAWTMSYQLANSTNRPSLSCINFVVVPQLLVPLACACQSSQGYHHEIEIQQRARIWKLGLLFIWSSAAHHACIRTRVRLQTNSMASKKTRRHTKCSVQAVLIIETIKKPNHASPEMVMIQEMARLNNKKFVSTCTELDFIRRWNQVLKYCLATKQRQRFRYETLEILCPSVYGCSIARHFGTMTLV